MIETNIYYSNSPAAGRELSPFKGCLCSKESSCTRQYDTENSPSISDSFLEAHSPWLTKLGMSSFSQHRQIHSNSDGQFLPPELPADLGNSQQFSFDPVSPSARFTLILQILIPNSISRSAFGKRSLQHRF